MKTLLRQLGTWTPEAGATPQLLPLKGEQGGQLSPHFLSGQTQNSPGPLIWQLSVHTVWAFSIQQRWPLNLTPVWD